jgi:ADP-heptose:LPS heptosyltransferase
VSGILVAPFSNSDIRDWPVGHYTKLIGLLNERLPADEEIRIIGTPGQRIRAGEIVRPYPYPRVANTCGRVPWPDLVGQLRTARCVIGNNSGIAHLSGRLGTPTVCVFGGSHQRLEWRPLGFNVALISRAIGCSPCQLDHGAKSPYGKACLREIEPEVVADAVFMIMRRVARTRVAAGDDAATTLESA